MEVASESFFGGQMMFGAAISLATSHPFFSHWKSSLHLAVRCFDALSVSHEGSDDIFPWPMAGLGPLLSYTLEYAGVLTNTEAGNW